MSYKIVHIKYDFFWLILKNLKTPQNEVINE